MIYDIDQEKLRHNDQEFHMWLDEKIAQVRRDSLEEAAEVFDHSGQFEAAEIIRGLK